MKIIRFIVGAVISVVALAIATKLAAFVLGLAFTLLAIVVFVVKVALIVGVAMFIFWAVSRLMQNTRKGESF
jgi:hypothetical protein